MYCAISYSECQMCLLFLSSFFFFFLPLMYPLFPSASFAIIVLSGQPGKRVEQP